MNLLNSIYSVKEGNVGVMKFTFYVPHFPTYAPYEIREFHFKKKVMVDETRKRHWRSIY